MRLFITLCFCLISIFSVAQLNVELLGEVSYNSAGNDIWGYTAPDGNEYALMGTQRGLSIVNITDPRNPIEITFISQARTIWRDIKTWENYAYVTSESGGDGVLVIDMSTLPDSVTYENVFLEVPSGQTIQSCHNIYIDEFGFAYLAGCNVNRRGVEIFDLKNAPGQMDYAGEVNNTYSHDVYARDNKLYNSELNLGVFAIYDVTNKDSIVHLGSQRTPFDFTHNTWLSDDGSVLFTTDERRNAPIGSYDVSDPANIIKLDEFKPYKTIGDGVIPHNVHVWSDWLIISYYTDGCIIVDASRPDNLIEVGNWDTYLSTNLGDGFEGAWGAYPFFPSGAIAIGDISGRLLILGPDYKRAAHLEGVVTDAETGNAIVNASIQIVEDGITEFSKAAGDYKTGTVFSGPQEIIVSKDGYFPVSRTVDLTNGELHIENFELRKRPQISISGTVVDSETGEVIPGASVSIIDRAINYNFITDDTGNFGALTSLAGEYTVIVGKWGYKYIILEDFLFDGSDLTPVVEVELDWGYEDSFSLDLGWETSLDGERGEWIRAIPLPLQLPNFPIVATPDGDSDDLGARAYVTGQSNDFVAGSLLGATTLRSPSFDPVRYEAPLINFEYWLWTTDDKPGIVEIPLTITLENGIDSVVIEQYYMQPGISGWQRSIDFTISDYIALTDDMRFSVDIANDTTFFAVEAGLDNFRILDEGYTSAEEVVEVDFSLYPNPSNGAVNITIPAAYQNAQSVIDLYDQSGMRVAYYPLSSSDRIITIDELLEAGVYFVKLRNRQTQTQVQKLIKTN